MSSVRVATADVVEALEQRVRELERLVQAKPEMAGLLSVRAAAKAVKVRVDVIYHACNAGELRHRMGGRKARLIEQGDLMRWHAGYSEKLRHRGGDCAA